MTDDDGRIPGVDYGDEPAAPANAWTEARAAAAADDQHDEEHRRAPYTSLKIQRALQKLLVPLGFREAGPGFAKAWGDDPNGWVRVWFEENLAIHVDLETLGDVSFIVMPQGGWRQALVERLQKLVTA